MDKDSAGTVTIKFKYADMNDLPKKQIAKLLGKIDPTVLDVGCHDGSDAAELSSLLPRANIHCFEPDPRIQKRFINKMHSDHMILQPFALGNVNGVVEFNQSAGRNNASGSIREPKEHLLMFPDITFPTKINVRCLTLDRWFFLNLHPAVIDFIWCDVNGAESDFLNGGWNTLNNFTRYLYIEFCEVELYAGALTLQTIEKVLPRFENIGVYNFEGNFGNVLLKNKTL